MRARGNGDFRRAGLDLKGRGRGGKRKESKMEPVAAKQFLISKVIEEAGIEQVRLSEVEKKMLYFTEVQPSLPDIYEINANFERDYDSDEYEAKIAGLLKNARDHDRQSSPGREQEWKEALDALKNEDHYILVMVSQAFALGPASPGGHRERDFLIYIGLGIGIFLVLLFVSFWRAHQ